MQFFRSILSEISKKFIFLAAPAEDKNGNVVQNIKYL